MMYALMLAWLVTLTVVQLAWCTYYGLSYRWRATPLGPVWLAKGSMLALLWPLLILNEAVRVPLWVWSLLIGPGLTAATIAWLWVTVHVHRPNARP